MKLMPDGPAPGSAEWRGLVTASKVPAIMGVSPWASPFSIWCEMTGRVEPEDAGSAAVRGQCLETGVQQWFEIDHPTWKRKGVQVAVRDEHEPRLMATLDGLYRDENDALVIVEVKTVGRTWAHWETETGYAPPAYYEAQVRFQLALVPEAEYAIIVALSPWLEKHEFRIDRDDELDAVTHEAAIGFLEYLEKDTAPELSQDKATYDALVAKHKGPHEGEIELDQVEAWALVNAAETERRAKALMLDAKIRAADALGGHQFATYEGKTIAKYVQPKGRKPYIQIVGKPDDIQPF